PLALRAALLRLFVEGARLAGRASALGGRAHLDVEALLSDDDRQLVAGRDEPRRLHRLPVAADVAGVDRLDRQRTRLEEARRPEPAGDPHRVARRGHRSPVLPGPVESRWSIVEVGCPWLTAVVGGRGSVVDRGRRVSVVDRGRWWTRVGG